MAQLTFTAGQVLTASQVNTYLAGEGGAWTSYTPTIDQGVTTNIAKTVNYAKYARYGRTIICNFKLTLTGVGTIANVVAVSLPVTASSTDAIAAGDGMIYDASGALRSSGNWAGASTTTVNLVVTGASGWGVTPSVALAATDEIRGSIIYEAAT